MSTESRLVQYRTYYYFGQARQIKDGHGWSVRHLEDHYTNGRWHDRCENKKEALKIIKRSEGDMVPVDQRLFNNILIPDVWFFKCYGGSVYFYIRKVTQVTDSKEMLQFDKADCL